MRAIAKAGLMIFQRQHMTRSTLSTFAEYVILHGKIGYPTLNSIYDDWKMIIETYFQIYKCI